MKEISIIGDSISTYYGFVLPDGYKVYYDEKKAKENPFFIKSMYFTMSTRRCFKR